MRFGILLGAGFSKWASNLPVASELFDFQINAWTRETRVLNIVKALKARWDQEHTGGQAEQFIADALTYSLRERKAVIRYISRRLVDPFVHEYEFLGRPLRHVLGIDDPLLPQIQGVKRTEEFLVKFLTLDVKGIITTNYDLLVEYALRTSRFHYGTPGMLMAVYRTRRNYRSVQDTLVLRGRIPVLKLHGSISWDNKAMYGDGRCGLKGSALIVPPALEKDRPDILGFQWQMAADVLEKCTALVVFGFSFNPYDHAVLELLKTAGHNLRAVLLIDIAPQVKRAQELWPLAEITECGPPPDGSQAIRSWQLQHA